MPTLYKKTDRKPIPEGAEFLTRKGSATPAGPISGADPGRNHWPTTTPPCSSSEDTGSSTTRGLTAG